MSLKSSIQGNAILPIALAIIISLGLIVESRVTGSARKRQSAADQALTLIVDFSSFSHALLLEEDKDANQQWENKRKDLDKFFNSREADELDEYLRSDLQKSFQRATAIIIESNRIRDLECY